MALVGHNVMLQGLEGRADINNRCGTAQSFVEARGRYAVRVPGLKEPLLLKPQNLTRIADPVNEITSCALEEHATEVRERVEAAASGQREGPGRVILDLEDCGLSRLPASVGVLSALEELWLCGNGLLALPESLVGLRALRRLDLDQNCLTTLPEGLFVLPTLEALYVNGNSLASLPPALAQLDSLRELRLSGNKFGEAPEVVGSLHNLRALWIADNELRDLPVSWYSLTSLTELDVSGNRIEVLPARIAQLPQLQELTLDRNPSLREPPPTVAALGVDAVRGWFVAQNGESV